MPSFVLEEVISELVDSNRSLSSPLLKLQYFAELTNNKELLAFVRSELNGYKEVQNMPDYRIADAQVLVDFQFGPTQHLGKVFPVEMIDEQHQPAFKYLYLNESVSVLEKIERDPGTDQFIIQTFPLSLLHFLQSGTAQLYTNPHFKARVFAAKKITNRNCVTSALTALRSRLLSFSMEIGKTFGYNIQIESFNREEINNKKIVTIMNTTITNNGDGNIVNTGAHASVNASIQINKGDKQELLGKLKGLGVEDKDINELEAIIDSETPDYTTQTLGHKTIDWITNVSGKALKGIGGIAKEVTSSLLANLIMQYFGIPS